MKTKTKKLWITAIAALLVTAFISSCKDENVATVHVCPAVVSTNPADTATLVPLTQIITVTFNEEMDRATITPASFTLQDLTPVTRKKISLVTGKKSTISLQGITSVAGIISYAGKTASFIPSGPLSTNTTYTGKVTASIKDLNGIALQADYVWTFSTGATILPTVISTSPADTAKGVALAKTITATFSVAMDPSSINDTTFIIKQGVTKVAGTISYIGKTASFKPSGNLESGKSYTAVITNAAKNVAGTNMANDYEWNFSTGAVVSPISPTVILTDPLDLAPNVVLNKIVTVTFSIAMDSLTVNSTTFTLKQGTTAIPGTYSHTATTASFKPNSNLLSGTTYKATVTTGAKNVPGTPMANDYAWTFTTGTIVAPTVILTDPLNLATNVVLTKIVVATFSMPMDSLTLTALTFTLKEGVNTVPGTFSHTATTVSFKPTKNLLSDATYTATITTGAKNLAHVSLANNYVWKFNTVAHLGPKAVDLKSVARFGIIAGVGVSNNAGPSVINNLDVGIYPGVRSSITGFPPATIVGGAMYASDDVAPPGVAAMLLQAQTDLTAAYIYAAGATAPAPATVSGDLGGQTLAPGIYKSTSTLGINTSSLGNLTLDAQGDVNAVWIFQVASAFTTIGGAPYPSPSGGNVILTGGAQAKNVYWQVGSSATIGDYTSFKGNVLAFSSITMGAYSKADGRMLARNAAVTLTSTNIINKP